MTLFTTQRMLFLAAATLLAAACSGSGAGMTGAATGTSGAGTRSSTSGNTTAGTTGGTSGCAACPDGGLTPIQLADAWVDGFYGTPAAQGVNRYDNTNVPGAPNGYYTVWAGDPGIALFGNVSDCSSFSDTLLGRSDGWIPATATSRPHADDYYWAIRNGAGFTQITNVSDVQVGDTIALLYPPDSGDTGHVAWIDALPQPFSGAPVEAGLSQFSVTIIDSTNGFHDGVTGPSTAADGRYLGRSADGGPCSTDAECTALYGPNALCNSTTLLGGDAVCSLMGVGRGQMRLYADSTGTLQGHTWSPNPESTFYPRPTPLPAFGGTFVGEDVVIGRYDGG